MEGDPDQDGRGRQHGRRRQRRHVILQQFENAAGTAVPYVPPGSSRDGSSVHGGSSARTNPVFENFGIESQPVGSFESRHVEDVIRQNPSDIETMVSEGPDAEQFQGYFQAALRAACGSLIGLYDRGVTIYDNSGKPVKDLAGWIKLASIVMFRTGGAVGVASILREVAGWQSTHNSDETNKAIAATATGLSTLLIAYTAYDRVKDKTATWRGLAGDAALTSAMLASVIYSGLRGEFNNMGSSAARAFSYGYARLILELFTRMGANLNDQTDFQRDMFLAEDTASYTINRLGAYTFQQFPGVSSGPEAAAVDLVDIDRAMMPIILYSVANGLGDALQVMFSAAMGAIIGGVRNADGDQGTVPNNVGERLSAVAGARMSLDVGWPKVAGRPATFSEFLKMFTSAIPRTALSRQIALFILFLVTPAINGRLTEAHGNNRQVNDWRAALALALVYACCNTLGAARNITRASPNSGGLPLNVHGLKLKQRPRAAPLLPTAGEAAVRAAEFEAGPSNSHGDEGPRSFREAGPSNHRPQSVDSAAPHPIELRPSTPTQSRPQPGSAITLPATGPKSTSGDVAPSPGLDRSQVSRSYVPFANSGVANASGPPESLARRPALQSGALEPRLSTPPRPQLSVPTPSELALPPSRSPSVSSDGGPSAPDTGTLAHLEDMTTSMTKWVDEISRVMEELAPQTKKNQGRRPQHDTED